MLFGQEFMPLEDLLFFGAASGGKLSELTASGNPCVFETDVARPLKRLSLSLLPRQSGSGDPSPQNIRSLIPWGEVGTWTGGKNLFDKSKYADIYDNPDYISDSYRCKYIQLVPYQTYTISQSAGTTDNTCVLLLNNKPNVNASGYFDMRKASDEKTYVTDETGRLYIGSVNSTSAIAYARIETCKLQIELGSTASAYETPSITPHPVNVGKNLLNYDTFENKSINSSGAEAVATTRLLSALIDVVANNTYFISFPTGYKFIGFCNFDSNGNWVSNVFKNNSVGVPIKPTSPRIKLYFQRTDSGNITKAELETAMLNTGETAEPYQPYLPPVYGCEVDLTTGEVWGTWKCYLASTLHWEGSTAFSRQVYVAIFDDTSDISNPLNILCDKYKTIRRGISITTMDDLCIKGNQSTGNVLYIRDTNYSTLEDFVASLGDTVICYQLATPVLLATLTPQQIATLIGTNTVWSDADGIDLTFLKKG